jgi:tripartite-type tricarboxylate transporter receptor subunit TctC
VVGGGTFVHSAKLDMLHVPYKSAPQAIQDLLAGRVQVMFNDFTTSLPHVQAKTMRPLAVSRIKRSTLFPELPTMDEAGVTGFDMDTWAGVFAPAGTPQPVITQLSTELRKIIDSDEVKGKLRAAGFEAFSSSPGELDDFVKVQLGKWGKMIKDAGIQPE